MRSIIYAVAVAIILSGCTTAKKYRGYIESLYHALPDQRSAYGGILCVLNIPVTFNGVVKLRTIALKQTYNNDFECELNPRIPFEIFAYQCLQYADSPFFLRELAGRRLEIKLISVPGSFKYVRAADPYSTPIGTMTEYSQSIYPIFRKLAFEYSLYDQASLVKEGKIVLESNECAFASKGMNWKLLVKDYLASYEKRLQILSRQGMKALAKQMQQ